MLNILGIITSVLSKITDSFNRSDGSIGSTDTGQAWQATRGTWTISSNKASTATSPSSYPIAAVDFASPSATIEVDVSRGSGAAFWISDSSNWWGLASVAAVSGSTCTTYVQTYSAGSPSVPGYAGGPYVPSSTAVNYFPSQTTYSCSSYTFITDAPYDYTPYQTCATYSSYTSPDNYQTVFFPATYGSPAVPYSPGTPDSYGQACSAYADTYSYSLSLIKSIANTVTTVATQALSSATASIRVILSGLSITATGYSESDQGGSNLGTLTNTATGATTTSKHGIILIPSALQQTTVDNFSIE
jgi:hypothetical protein